MSRACRVILPYDVQLILLTSKIIGRTLPPSKLGKLVITIGCAHGRYRSRIKIKANEMSRAPRDTTNEREQMYYRPAPEEAACDFEQVRQLRMREEGHKGELEV